MNSDTEKKKKDPRSMPIYLCPHCGDGIRGNGFARHEASCKRKLELGKVTKKLYPIPLPVLRYDAFSAWCLERNLTLAEGVDKLIEEKVG